MFISVSDWRKNIAQSKIVAVVMTPTWLLDTVFLMVFLLCIFSIREFLLGNFLLNFFLLPLFLSFPVEAGLVF